jgi:carboxypeptidase T
MMVLKLTNSAITDPKPRIFMSGAIHAREYATVELVTRLAEYLVTNYGTDADATWMLDHHEVHIMLHANPDGRKQAETGLSWRKNTNQDYCSPTSNYRGADLNRNFEFKWNCCGGSSDYECDSTYHGAYTASEPEAQAMQNYMRSLFPDQRGPNDTDAAPLDATGIFLDIHSHGRLILWPWSWTPNPAPNAAGLQTFGRKMAYFNGHEPKQGYGLYPADGTTKSFGYGELGIPAYTIELGTTFFESCTYFENTLVPDNMPMLLYAIKVCRTPCMTPSGPDAVAPALDSGSAPTGVPPGTVVTLTASINDTRYNNTNGTEPSQNIAAAEYYVDIPPWVTSPTPAAFAMSPSDGTFDSTVESAEDTIDTTGWSGGRHIIFVRGQNTDGNWGAFSAVFLYINNDPPTAAFSGSPTSGTTPLAVSFTDESTGATSWSWDFGDTGTSTEKDPDHIYTAVGTYTVSLTVTNPFGSDAETKIDYIAVTAPQPSTADFTANSTTITEGQNVTFTDLSTNNPTSWSWIFAGGTPSTSTDQNPNVTYNTAGTFNAGKNVGEDPDAVRADETVGYVVFEQGGGTINSTPFIAAVGADTVRGPDNTSSGYTYTFSSVPNASSAIVSVAGMDGGNGGWPVMYGSTPLTGTSLVLVFDEDQVNDS